MGSSGAFAGRLNPSSFNKLKTIKITLASLLVFALTGLASAQSPLVLRITGSTAYRAATLVAISNVLKPGYQVAYVASAAEPYSKANMVLFTGTTTTNVSVQIKTAFFGSIGGVANVAGGLTVGPGGTAYTDGQTIGWLSTSNPTAPGSVSGNVVSGGQNIAASSAVFDTATVADITMSDSFQASAPALYQTPKLKGKIVGVVPFVFICSPGTTTTSGTVSNLSSKFARKLLGGTLLLSNLTGKTTDSHTHVYAVGRDQDSGTRIGALSDTAYGITKDVFQYQPLYNGATTPTSPPPTPSGTITGAALWPATPPVDSVNSPTGDSGYNSGGLVGASIAVTSSYTNWFIAYVGLNDGLTALGNAKNFVLKFNGGSLTETGGVWALSSVENGTYKFWGYEHFLYKSLSGQSLTVAQLIQNDILSTTAPVSGVAISTMTVHRNSDGGAIQSGGTPPNTP
jgi:hypothetical protein